MTELFFIRHAQSCMGWADDAARPLTSEGERDAAQVTRVLHDTALDAVVSSPYVRALSTLRGCAMDHGLDIETDRRLIERMRGQGGGTEDWVRKRWADFACCEPGGESLASVQRRNMAAVTDILHRYAGKAVAIGTHGTALSTILRWYDPAFDGEAFFRMEYYMPYIVHMTFDGETLVEQEELLIVQKNPQ